MEYVGIKELRDRLSAVIDSVRMGHKPVAVTRGQKGTVVAFVVPADFLLEGEAEDLVEVVQALRVEHDGRDAD